MMSLILVWSLACMVAKVTAAGPPDPADPWDPGGVTDLAVEFRVQFPHLKFRRPLYITHPRNGHNRLFVVEQAGRIWAFENDPAVETADLVLDIRDRVRRHGNEEGLLGLALAHRKAQWNPNQHASPSPPPDPMSQKVYLHYTAAQGQRRNVLASFVMDDASGMIDPASERVILEVEQPWSNHNGGMIEFGPDGYLYVGLGDGGAANDPKDHGQDLSTLLGTILRIDVDRSISGVGTDTTLAYAIPTDNPFVDRAEARDEIWAYGLRNPWRFSFDRMTGDLWAGDVGQNKWEEIDLIQKGGNYGWNKWEGNHPFNPPNPTEVNPQSKAGPMIGPIVEHDHGQARSITGGYVYHGKNIPWLVGAYIYGDFETGLVWMLRYDGKRVTEHRYLTRVRTPASFGEDRDGELYVTSFDGRIYKLVTIDQ